MVNHMKNLLIGLFVAVAIALIVGIILFLEPSVGDGKQTIVVRFSNINGISLGTRVMFAGKPVGEVVRIEQIPHAREQPIDDLGQIYFYQLILHIDSTVKVYNTDELTMQTSGLLGEKSIAIIPRAPPKGVKPKLITENTPVYAESVDPLESAFSELSSVADKVEEALDKVIAWIDQNGAEVGSAIRSFDDAMREVSIAVERVNKIHLIDDVKLAVQNFSDSMKQINDAMHTMKQEGTFENIGVMVANLKKASFSVDSVLTDIKEGKGTIGRLLVQDDMYLQMQAIFSKVDTLMNDVNHYGLFFNLNKEWQRSRLKQVSFINALNTPQSFKDYFEKEVSQINTSMSRLSMVIDKAEVSPDKEKIMESTPFKKDFAELLRLTKEMSDNLRLYNEQLTQAQGE